MTSEFKSLDEMNEDELTFERCQRWMIVKSDTAWWLHRNDSPFMRVTSEREGHNILADYGIRVYAVDRSQGPTTEKEWNEFRRDKMRVLSGRGPSLVRRVWRWMGGDAA